MTPPPPQRKSGKIKAVSRKARRSRVKAGACALTPRLPVAKARRTMLRGAGKGSLVAGSLNPHPISQVPRVKPAKGPWLNHRAATPPAPRANPWGPAAFFFFFFGHKARRRSLLWDQLPPADKQLVVIGQRTGWSHRKSLPFLWF